MAKVVFISGANRGIGKSLSKEFHRRGYKVYASDLFFSPETVTEYDSLGIHTLKVDVTDQSDIERARDTIASENDGRLDYLYNNAGIVHVVSCVEQTEEDFLKVYKVNFLGPVQLTRAFIPLLIKAKGTVLFSGSVTQTMPLLSNSLYTSSKAALDQWASTLQVEVYRYGVKVLNVLGGSIDTTIFDTTPKQISPGSIYDFPEYREAYSQRKKNLNEEAKKGTLSMPPDVFARRVLDQVEKSDEFSFHIFEGGKASRYYLIGRLAPRKLLINKMLNIFKLNFDYREHLKEPSS